MSNFVTFLLAVWTMLGAAITSAVLRDLDLSATCPEDRPITTGFLCFLGGPLVFTIFLVSLLVALTMWADSKLFPKS